MTEKGMGELEIQSLAVFCGSSAGKDPVYIEQATAFGKLLAENEMTLVYGGAQVGCMGAVANACLQAGGRVIGAIPKKLQNVEIAHDKLSELYVVDTMHERKALMAEHADAFVALPGGAGTLEEWFEVFTWIQLDYHQKPCSLLNVADFFNPLLAMLDHTIEQGFMAEAYRDLFIVEKEPQTLLERLQRYRHQHVSKWTENG
jgi:uncharacterized protein (TIGR00730 family)